MISEKTLNTLLAVGVVVALVVLGFAIFTPPATVVVQPAPVDTVDVEPASAALSSVITTASVKITMTSTPASTAIVYPGEYITYTIVVSNTSGEVLPMYDVLAFIPTGTAFDAYTASLSATTVTPASLHWELTNLAAGSSVTLGYRVRAANLATGSSRLIVSNYAILHVANTTTSTDGTVNTDAVSHIIENYHK